MLEELELVRRTFWMVIRVDNEYSCASNKDKITIKQVDVDKYAKS